MVLFEVVIALVIFSLVAFGLAEALSASFDATTDRNDIDAAVRGLNNQIALLHAARVLPGDRDLPDDGSGFTYRVSVTQEQMFDQKKVPLNNMYRATVTVNWKSHGEAQTRSVSQLIYQP